MLMDPVFVSFYEALATKGWFLYLPPREYQNADKFWRSYFTSFYHISRSEWWRQHPLSKQITRGGITLTPDTTDSESWMRIVKAMGLEPGKPRRPILLPDKSVVEVHTFYPSTGWPEEWKVGEVSTRGCCVVVKERYSHDDTDALRDIIRNVLVQVPNEAVRVAKLLRCMGDLEYYRKWPGWKTTLYKRSNCQK